MDALEQQVTDLQDRSRRSNLRLLGLPEGAEKDDPIGFLKRSLPTWIPSLAGKDIEIERAHRVYSRASTDHSKPRVFLFKLLRYNDRNLILNEARRHAPVKANDGAMLSFFPDFSPMTAKKRSSFSAIRKELKEAGLQTFLQYPATLKIVLKHGETKLMQSPDEARQFLNSLPGSHSPRMDVV
ncbi:LINE-1 type transposase domain-containing 1 [Labeo rohita]|uniref:LINE-1 type transposase domain-containing 1 n=1 Tax=Labeo rohita TaxID=84645 RepID=A0A498MRR2_LABRO|nr:LINE-1 type transposase domain-containing 1 [Labeo rohita]